MTFASTTGGGGSEAAVVFRRRQLLAGVAEDVKLFAEEVASGLKGEDHVNYHDHGGGYSSMVGGSVR